MTFCAGAGEGSRSNAAARATATAKAADLRIMLISLICHREPCTTLDAGRGDLFTLSSRAPKGRGDLSTLSSRAPKGRGDLFTLSSRAPKGRGDLSTLSSRAPKGRGDLSTLSSRAPKGRGDLLARRLLRAFGPRNDKLAGCPKAFLCVASFPASAAASPPSQRESQTRCSPPAST